ncbi:hypothetical protein AGMMS4956_04240 [Bacteroidia bacterium]|nr:hypothetical protein AGMMS4956_04240 [Bacteroidia bacterium]
MSAKICVSLANIGFEECLAAMQKYSLVELRLDLLSLEQEQITTLLQQKCPTIVTCRADQHNDTERLQHLLFAIDAGATYVDIEFESAIKYRQLLIERAQEKGCRVIISYHNFDCTPSKKELQNVVNQSITMGADLVKLVTFAHHSNDAAGVMSLYETCYPLPFIGFAMGEAGKITRIAAPLLGAPFTYAALTNGNATASGQLTAAQLETIFCNLI